MRYTSFYNNHYAEMATILNNLWVTRGIRVCPAPVCKALRALLDNREEFEAELAGLTIDESEAFITVAKFYGLI